MAGDAINTWKGIAAYLGRGVRTVQRWEQELHLPVHRPRNKYRSAVIALRSDLDRWLAGTPVLKKTLVQLADSEPTEQMLQMRLAHVSRFTRATTIRRRIPMAQLPAQVRSYMIRPLTYIWTLPIPIRSLSG